MSRRRGDRRRRSRPAPPKGRERAETVAVRDVGARGDGVAQLADGRTAFIAGALVGERVEVSVAPRAAHRACRARLLRVLEPSPGRATPSCPFAGACGGCDLMHATASLQRDYHCRRVQQLLARALQPSIVPEPTVHSPGEPFGYRTRARLLVRADPSGVTVGYRGSRSHHLVAVGPCAVLHADIAPVLDELDELLVGAHGQGEALVARGLGRRPVVDLHWRGRLGANTFATADHMVRETRWSGAQIWVDRPRQPAVFGDPRPRVAGPHGRELIMAAGGFAQPSDAGAVALARRVAELLGAAGRTGQVVELFAGSGTLSVALAGRAERLLAVERDELAAACLRANLTSFGSSARVSVADANEVNIPRAASAVILDPPRAGARGAVTHIARARPRVVIYVSCFPATFARDLAALAGTGYSLDGLELFELFPQTSHVEAVARLSRRG